MIALLGNNAESGRTLTMTGWMYLLLTVGEAAIADRTSSFKLTGSYYMIASFFQKT